MLIQLETQYSKPKPRSVFYSYSHKDEDLRDELDAHLKLLKRDGFISTWHDRKIRPGDEWDHVINENLDTADVILFLVSHHFLASQYCRDIEVKRALERVQKREAILIPIIIRPCVWTSEEFAKLQVLPKNCRPLAEWPDSGFAQVTEELRTMLVDMLYPQKPSEATSGQHGNWIIKLRSRPDIDSKDRAQQVVARLREYTEDFSINLQATATTQIMDGAKAEVGLMLILTGTPEAFAILDKAQRDGQLATAIDEDILSLYVIFGATVESSSVIGASASLVEVEGGDNLVRPGRKVTPPLIKGMYLPKDGTTQLDFIIDMGNSQLESAQSLQNTAELIEYFKVALAAKDDDIWVNLSAFEADRMLPKHLSGTQLGRKLLAQDCLLKRLTASLMHPDSPTGREYWGTVYSEARRLCGTAQLPFRCFQKVWVIPSKALVYENDGDDTSVESSLRNEGKENFCKKGHLTAYVVEMAMDVKCEEDLLAKGHRMKDYSTDPLGTAPNMAVASEIALSAFQRIILPQLHEEVNEGEHFAELRRIYSALVLATWVKRKVKAGLSRHAGAQKLIESNDWRSCESSILGIRSLNLSNEASVADTQRGDYSKYAHVTPTAPAFDVPENVEFFEQYMRLFKNGIYRCARSEAGDSPDERIIRVYFSGALDFRSMPLALAEPSEVPPTEGDHHTRRLQTQW